MWQVTSGRRDCVLPIVIPPLTISAPFSPIMRTAALMLPGGNRRHDGRIDDTQAVHTAHMQLRTDDGHLQR